LNGKLRGIVERSRPGCVFTFSKIFAKKIQPGVCWTDHPEACRKTMQRRIFWLLLITLGIALDVALPWTWSLALSLPLVILCWWIAYRSGWFE
jgi:hypothetical protein